MRIRLRDLVIVAIAALALSGLTTGLWAAGASPDEGTRRLRPVKHDPIRVWLWENSVRLDSVDGVGPTTDLLPLSPWVAGADIIALGDGTHGTREFYTVKRRLVQFFAEAGIARTVVFEGPWPEFLKLNEYIQGGDGDPREVLRTMKSYPFWKAEEIVELAVWAREFNGSRGAGERIEILGGDVLTDDPRAAADVVLEFLQGVDPVAASAATESYACVPASIKTSAQCGTSITSVRVLLEQNADAWQGASSLRSYQRALHTARVLEQVRGYYAVDPLERDTWRDAHLADNVQWFSDVWTGSEGLVVWMHNEHIGNLPAIGQWKSMGQHLKERFDSRYLTVGTCMLNGTLRRYIGTETDVIAMQAPLPSNYEVMFSRAGWSAMAVPLFHPDNPEWLKGPGNLRFGTAGYRPSGFLDHNPSYSLPDKFDVILYIEETTATHPLNE